MEVLLGQRRDHESISAFGKKDGEQTALEQMLSQSGITTVFVAGMAYDFQVGETAIDAIMRGYESHIVMDACCSLDIESQLLMD